MATQLLRRQARTLRPHPFSQSAPSPASRRFMQTQLSQNPFLVTKETIDNGLKTAAHPLDTTAKRQTLSLGDSAGLTQQGVHMQHVFKGRNRSSLPHWHSAEEEWFYILSGSGSAIIVEHPPSGEPQEREVTVSAGDFLGFPANADSRRYAHCFMSGDEEDLVYLCGGTRVNLDVVHYPQHNEMMMVSRLGGKTQSIDVAEGKSFKPLNWRPST